MGARDEFKARAAASAKTEDVVLGNATVRVKGMLLGERNRVLYEAMDASGKLDLQKAYPLVLGLCVVDVDSGKPLWNPNDWNDCEEIRGMQSEDADALFTAAMRLSGMDGDAAVGKA